MDKHVLEEIIACLPGERTLFRYFKDRYALMLLDNYVGEGKSVADIRQSEFAHLLNKPVVKALLAWAGNGYLTRNLIKSFWLDELYTFVLTVGQWDGLNPYYDQTSRKGHNLVLQLNFSNQHDGLYRKLVKPEFEQMLNHAGHPILDWSERPYRRETLAWARIDLDFSTNQALIEEVQSDWVRKAKQLYYTAEIGRLKGNQFLEWYGIKGKVDSVLEYYRNVLSPYQKFWSEAILAAAIEFIRTELGIGEIYFHSTYTGCMVKSIDYDYPPRSLYSKLPERFCFRKTDEAPKFLFEDKGFRKRYKKIYKQNGLYLKFKQEVYHE